MMRLLGNRVLVALEPSSAAQDATTGYSYKPSDTTASGLILAMRADAYDPDASTRGIVMQVGEKRGSVDLDEARAEVNEYFLSEDIPAAATYTDISADVDRLLMKLLPAPFEVQVGDCIVFPPSAGHSVTADGIAYVILAEDDILGILEPSHKEPAA